jgi:hypothetical protein
MPLSKRSKPKTRRSSRKASEGEGGHCSHSRTTAEARGGVSGRQAGLSGHHTGRHQDTGLVRCAAGEWGDDRHFFAVEKNQRLQTAAKHLIGESVAITLATEMNADVMLIDDQAGRQETLRRRLKVAGTLSILDEADQARAGQVR